MNLERIKIPTICVKNPNYIVHMIQELQIKKKKKKIKHPSLKFFYKIPKTFLTLNAIIYKQ